MSELGGGDLAGLDEHRHQLAADPVGAEAEVGGDDHQRAEVLAGGAGEGDGEAGDPVGEDAAVDA